MCPRVPPAHAAPAPLSIRSRSALQCVVFALATAACGDGSPTSAPDNPAPTITSLSPASVSAGGPAFTLTVNGSGFIEGSTVRWAGSARPTTFVSSTRLTAQIAASDIGTSGMAAITVTNPAPGGGTSSSSSLEVVAVAVASVEVSPASDSIVPGETRSFTATLRAADGTVLTGREVTWSVADAGVASVDGTGVLLGVAPGQTTVSALSEGVTGQAGLAVRPGGVVDGGETTLGSPGGDLTLHFPPGSVSTATPIAIAAHPNPPAHQSLIEGTAWELAPAGTTFAAPVTITIEAPTGIGSAGVHRWNGSEWVPIDGHAQSGSSVSGTTLQTGLFALLSISPPALRALEVTAGGTQSCAIDTQGQAWCWGWGGDGQLGNGERDDELRPVPVSGGHDFATITAGFYHTCAIDTDGDAWCWGWGDSGRLGTGSQARELTPARVTGSHLWEHLSAGGAHTCGVTDQGEGFCWGWSVGGRLGGGNIHSQASPHPVSGSHTFSMIEAGGIHSCALDDQMLALCWGSAAEGQLGDDSNPAQVPVPVAVSGGLDFTSIGVGTRHSCALGASGEVYCWGQGAHGKLGNGDTQNRLVPTQVAGGRTFAQLSVGWEHSCALTPEGEAWCWGEGEYGRLGNGALGDRAVPTPVDGGLLFRSIASGDWHTCGITLDDEVYCWGWGDTLGTGEREDSAVPVPVPWPG